MCADDIFFTFLCWTKAAYKNLSSDAEKDEVHGKERHAWRNEPQRVRKRAQHTMPNFKPFRSHF